MVNFGVGLAFSYAPIPSELNHIRTAHGHTSSSVSLMNTFEGAMMRDIMIRNITASDVNLASASATSSLGGGVILIRKVLLFQAVINSFGLLPLLSNTLNDVYRHFI
ncbi:MAG: hypothetical protein FWG67_00475 [Defluviitaleaceae bacterium]|nr:hypothetical protein [Defluviitaleaceae bacterium]